jgi:hypothetical protein
MPLSKLIVLLDACVLYPAPLAYSTRIRSLIPILFDHRFRLYLITDSTLI